MAHSIWEMSQGALFAYTVRWQVLSGAVLVVRQDAGLDKGAVDDYYAGVRATDEEDFSH